MLQMSLPVETNCVYLTLQILRRATWPNINNSKLAVVFILGQLYRSRSKSRASARRRLLIFRNVQIFKVTLMHLKTWQSCFLSSSILGGQ